MQAQQTALEPTNGARLPALPIASRNAARVFLAGCDSANTRRTYEAALVSIVGVIAATPELAQETWQPIIDASADRQSPLDVVRWGAIRTEQARAIKSLLQEQPLPETGKPRKYTTVNKMLSALRGVLDTACDMDQMTGKEYRLAVKQLRMIRGKTGLAGRYLSAGESGAILTACQNDHGPSGDRDAALFGLLRYGGLRRTEAVELDLADYDTDTGELKVIGKGNKERTVWVTNGTLDALADWLAVRGDEPGPLFLPVNKGGRVIHSRMTSQAVYKMLGKRATEGKVKDFSPHDLRRSFITDQLNTGTDVLIVARIVGHANVQTTGRYDMRPEAAKRDAMATMHMPWQRRRAI